MKTLLMIWSTCLMVCVDQGANLRLDKYDLGKVDCVAQKMCMRRYFMTDNVEDLKEKYLEIYQQNMTYPPKFYRINNAPEFKFKLVPHIEDLIVVQEEVFEDGSAVDLETWRELSGHN